MTAYYVNVADWNPEQVAEWVRGLDDTLIPYIRHIMEQEINGLRLLSTTVEDLPVLKVIKLGHQEIFMGAIDLLRDFHYNLDRENLQFFAMQLGCKARSLYNELCVISNTSNRKSEQVTTSTLAAVADIIDGVKDLVSWLDRSPFDGHEPYLSVKAFLLKICLELATNAQRDLFAENPVEVIRQGCISLAGITDKIICEFVDPLVLQPASLDVATIKKKPEEDLGSLSAHSLSNGTDGIDLWIQGMLIQTSYKGVHAIGGVKFQSPAHQCGKIEEGDEVVQVNYQTVVGWEQKKLKAAMLENSTKVILTLKKRPRHSNNFGQIYVKPYRLPSKKRDSYHFRWHLNTDGQTKPDLQVSKPIDTLISSVPLVHIAPPISTEVAASELPSEVESDNDTDDDSFLPDNHHHDPVTAAAAAAAVAAATGIDNSVTSPASVRLILPKNRLSIQRRATVTGASPTSSRPPLNIEQFWKELKEGQGQRGKAPELFDLLVQQQQQQLFQLEQRPHSSMGHYNGLPRQTRQVAQTDCNANHSTSDKTDDRQLLSVDQTGRTATIMPVSEEMNEDKSGNVILRESGEVEIRSQSRKVSLERPRLDKSQSTPTYESVVEDSTSFEEKLRNIRLQKQNRVSEEEIIPLVEVPNDHPSPSSDDIPRLSPKPALPPRNKMRLPEEELPLDRIVNHPTPDESNPETSIKDTDTTEQEIAGYGTIVSSQTPPHEYSHMGLRPHEVRDLIRRGLWPQHPTDEERALPALTRVTRLDSNFDPVPGSTVPRIAPSLLVTYAPAHREEEEVHVTLPPIKYPSQPHSGSGNGGATGLGGSSIGALHSSTNNSPLGRLQHHQFVRHPAQHQEHHGQHHYHQQHLMSGGRGSPVDGGRRVPCRELGEGDCQGWLSRRRQTRGFWSGPRWTRRFFVLKRHTLYGYRDPEDKKAESLICLPGFGSTQAPEVKSKKFAFKIFNAGTVFYFACESKEELNKWLNIVMQSATAPFSHGITGINKDTVIGTKGVYYSETEDESYDESESNQGSLARSLGRRKGKGASSQPVNVTPNVVGMSTTLGRTRRGRENSLPPVPVDDKNPSTKVVRSPMAASLDRKYLKRFLRVAPEKQPVPTSQFRSYRKPSPSPSPTTISAPMALATNISPSHSRTDAGSKPPPRPPSESKPASPFRPQLSSSSDATKAYAFEFPPTNTQSFAGRHATEPVSPSPNSSASVGVFQDSPSVSKLVVGQTYNQQCNPLELPLEQEESRIGKTSVSPRRSISRRHSIEITDVKKHSSKGPVTSSKPQLAPKPANLSMRTLGRPFTQTGSSTNLPFSQSDLTHRRGPYGSLNRTSRDFQQPIDLLSNQESGYAKIKPRQQSSSNSSDLCRSPPTRTESVGRRSSVASSRRSSTDGSIKSSGNSSSLSKLPSSCSTVSASLSPNRGTVDLNLDPSGRGQHKEGPPDQLWINSLRGGSHLSAPPIAPKPTLKGHNGQTRLKRTACYQPMNFPASPKDDSKMKAAFEMNLDVGNSSPTENEEMKRTPSDAKHFFKMLVSPKFGRKTLSSPSSQTPPENKFNAADTSVSPPPPSTPRMQKTLLGSPRLHRAIFGTPKDKRKNKIHLKEGSVDGKLLQSNSLQLPSGIGDESVLGTPSSIDCGNESISSHSSLSSDLSPHSYSPNSRLHQRPAPLVNAQPRLSSSPIASFTTSNNEESSSSCPGTPKTPLLKPAMGVSMIGKQRRTPLTGDSPYSGQCTPLSPQPSVGDTSRDSRTLRSTTSTSSATHFTYTVSARESPMESSAYSSGELEYPPVFEPGTYSLSEKKIEINAVAAVSDSGRKSLSSLSMSLTGAPPPVPAPRTKFLTSPSNSRLSCQGSSPSIESAASITSPLGYEQSRVQVFMEDSSSSNA